MGGSRRLQPRVELYNVFDTYQWTAVNTNAEFSFTTGELTNPKIFGRLTGATNSARRTPSWRSGSRSDSGGQSSSNL